MDPLHVLYKLPLAILRPLLLLHSIAQMFMARIARIDGQRRRKLEGELRKVTSRSGLANSLAGMVAALGPDFTVLVNGKPCELLAFRRKSQQGSKLGFRVHAVSLPVCNVVHIVLVLVFAWPFYVSLLVGPEPGWSRRQCGHQSSFGVSFSVGSWAWGLELCHAGCRRTTLF